MKRMGNMLLMALLFICSASAVAQEERVEMVKCGNMDSWIVREIEESFLIGGETKILHEIGPHKVLKGDTPYRTNSQSPWATLYPTK